MTFDFAGATTVHSLGGWAALAGLLVVGNRRGRYAKSGKRIRVAGSNVPLATLGLFIVWLGFLAWMGGQANQAIEAVPRILLATMVASAASGATVLGLGLLRGGVPVVETVVRGVLAGLVAIAGGGHAMGAPQALVVGVVAGFVLLGGDRLLERRRIDDAIGAVSVHLGAGLWGTVAVALLGEPVRLGTGLALPAQLLAQLEGALACAVWGFGIGLAACKVIALLGPLRVTPEEEFVGLDVSEHQAATEHMDVAEALDETARHETPFVPGEPFAELAHIYYGYHGHSGRDGPGEHGGDGEHGSLITSANPIASAIFGYGEAEFKKVAVTSLFAPIRDEPLDLDSLQASLDATPREMRGLRRTGEEFEMEVSLGSDAEPGGGSIVVRDITARKESEAGFTHTTEAIKRRLGLELEESRITAGFAATGEHSIPGGDLALLAPPGTDWFGAYHDGDGHAVTLYGGDLVTQVSSTSALLSSVLAGGGYIPGAEDTHGLLLGDGRYPPERQLRNLADVLNRIVSRQGRGEVLLAMTFIHLDLGTGHVTIVNAGRRAPTLLKSGRTVRDIGGGGHALGYAGDAEIQVSALSLAPGDLLVLCGEGMVDTISPDGTMLRAADLKKRILGRQTARDVLGEIATQSAIVWRGAHDRHPVLTFSWKPRS